jgi:hypothetical protein
MNKIDLIIDALEAGLKLSDGFISEWNQINKALAAARELKAEKQEPVPVGMTYKVWTHGCALFDGIDLPNETLLYTAPPRKEWVGLTGLEVSHYNSRLSGSGVAEEIEAKLRERNT